MVGHHGATAIRRFSPEQSPATFGTTIQVSFPGQMTGLEGDLYMQRFLTGLAMATLLLTGCASGPGPQKIWHVPCSLPCLLAVA
jgi:hypothetical protein